MAGLVAAGSWGAAGSRAGKEEGSPGARSGGRTWFRFRMEQ